MNTKSIYTVGKCLLLLLLIFTGYACEDNDEGKENTSAPVLISCNINGTEVDLANIDSETEEVIQHSLKKMRKGRTTIAIAHRLSTIQDADCIYVLDKGRIIESGTHDQLLALEGTYQKMYQLQAGQLQ